ncbi:MAG: TonB-dependent receptor [Sphingobium sp.]|jgi:iron complex outermembrane recepter protein|uniref:TonB-dependent receptor n=1 Tax=Sphingobium sp. TaxID=1912891 RepID=UPI0017C152B6|nr:TonB-dependent receptor [Sphingobium sp.]MBA4755673.1 TonB-dependent receptor [Sphingobium sp.]
MVQRKNGTIKITLWEGQAAMFAKKFSVGVSSVALAICGAGLGLPAYAQDAGATKASDAEATDESIIVTARRQALKDAINIKRDSDTIVDSVVADEAGKLPDTSVTEVLQRVSGVALSRFAVSQGNPAFQIEGSGISVRGLPYNSSMLNGRQVFSASGASAISWNDITPELMAAVDVYKASRADLIEGGASLVDLRTRVPFDLKKPEIAVTIGGSYGDLSEKYSPNASILWSKTWDTGIGQFGILQDFAFARLQAQSSDMKMRTYFAEHAPGSPLVVTRPDGPGGTVDVPNVGLIPYGYDWSNSQYKRDRIGAYQALQWKPNSDLTFTNTFFYSQYDVDSLSSNGGFGARPSASAVYIPVDPVYDDNGAMIAGSLRYGATGQVVYGQGGNTWLGQYSPGWSPRPDLDCGSQAGYGGPVSTATADWANGVYGCTEPLTNLQGFTGSRSVGKSKNSTMDISQSFVWAPGDRVRIRGALQYVKSQAKSKNIFATIVQEDPNLSSASFDLRGPIPVVGGFDADALANTETAFWSSMAYSGVDNEGRMLAGNLDLDYDFGDDSFFKSVSVGARASVRNEDDNFIGNYWAPLAQPWAGLKYYLSGDRASPLGSSDDYELHDFPNFFGGAVPSPGAVLLPSAKLMKNFDWYRLQSAYNTALNVTNPDGSITPGTRDEYYDQFLQNQNGVTDTKVQNFAGYVQMRFGREATGSVPRFTGNIGVRLIGAKLRSFGQLSQNQASNFYLDEASAAAAAQAEFNGQDPDPTTIFSTPQSSVPRTIEYSYFRVLPSFNIKFDLSPQVILRGAASDSVSPPNLDAIRAGGNINPTTMTITYAAPGGGDPVSQPILTNFVNQSSGAQLKPVMIRSQDISLEWYPRGGTMLYLNLFAKQVRDQDVFTAFTQVQPTPIVNGNGETVTVDIPWTYLQNQTTTEKSHLRGFEVGARTFFDKLPGLLSGFGVNLNFTFVDSKNPGPMATDVLGNDFDKLPIFNLSKYAYNAELLYSKGRVNARAAYNWRSKQLLSTNANPLSFATSGGNPYWAILSPTDYSETYAFEVFNMVPLWGASAGYLDLSFDYKFSDKVTLNAAFNNVLNTKSRTYQEPLPGVFLPYNTNISDRRANVTLRARF